MSNPVRVMGDKTRHGGAVITCSLFSDTHRKGWARVGDMVYCPRCKEIFFIAQGVRESLAFDLVQESAA